MIISDEDAQKAFSFLRESEEQHAQAKADLEALKKHENALIAKLKLQSPEKTSAAKEDDAYSSPEYEQWEAGMKVATYNYTLLMNKRERAMTTMDLWRTCQASARRGI